jgi:hypothetical protein
MYIVLETLAGNDLRLVPQIEIMPQYKYWAFEVAFIDPSYETSVDLSNIVHKIVPEHVARACKFASADHSDRLGIVQGSQIHEEMMHATLEHHQSKPKVYYQMTEQDINDAIEFYKVVLSLALEVHYRDLPSDQAAANADTKLALQNEIDSITTILEARELMHTKFGTASSHLIAEQNNWGSTQVQLSQ